VISHIIANTHNKNTTTPRIHSRVMEAEVRLRRDVAVLAIANPRVERMTRRWYSVSFGCHERLDHDDNIRDDGRLDGPVLAKSMSSIVEPDGE